MASAGKHVTRAKAREDTQQSAGNTRVRHALIQFVSHWLKKNILYASIPPDKSGSSGPGMGNCWKRYCPGGRGWGKSKIVRAKHVSCVRTFIVKIKTLGWYIKSDLFGKTK